MRAAAPPIHETQVSTLTLEVTLARVVGDNHSFGPKEVIVADYDCGAARGDGQWA
jgi:hypothetical protein